MKERARDKEGLQIGKNYRDAYDSVCENDLPSDDKLIGCRFALALANMIFPSYLSAIAFNNLSLVLHLTIVLVHPMSSLAAFPFLSIIFYYQRMLQSLCLL